MNQAFLDTSVVVQFLVGETGDLTERTVLLFDNLSDREEILFMPTTVIFETVYVLHGTYGVPRVLIAEKLSRFIGLPEIMLLDANVVIEAFSLWVAESPLSFADCFHLVLAKALGISRMYSFDKKMNRYPGVTRVEP